MNVENRTIFEGDNLDILRGFDSETIDLIYLDPPFNSNKTYEAPIGSDAAGAAFKDSWSLSDLDNKWHGELAESEPALYSAIAAAEFTHGKSMKAYLIMMGIRMLEMRRILKPTGSIYLHCDPTASHYLKLVMDSVFGHQNFRNEIVWCYSRPSSPKQRQLSRVHDIIFWYSKGTEWIFNPDPIRQPYARSSREREGYSAQASKVASGTVELDSKGKFPESWIYIPPLKGNSKEYMGYPTQKPLTLLERVIKASSNTNDIVLDPFCGCATTCIASERWQRQWIGIDLSAKAVELVKTRLERDEGLTEHGNLFAQRVIHRTDIPERLVPDSPEEIQPIALFNMPTIVEESMSQVQLQDYRTHKHELFGLQEGKCNGCEYPFNFRNMTIDHITPRSRGGTHRIENLQLLCGACNSTKGSGTQEQLKQKLKDTGVLR